MSTKNLFRKVLWFENRGQFDIDYFEMLQPRRQVSHKPRFKSGVFHSEKCGRGIQYESGLELEFIKSLESYQEVIFYWEQPIEIPYWRGKLKAKTYPDFGIYLKPTISLSPRLSHYPTCSIIVFRPKLKELWSFAASRVLGSC